VAPVDQDGELDRARAAVVAQGVEGRAYGAPGHEDVVDQHHDGLVDPRRRQLGLGEGARGA
jgi:hypothetical protein